MKKGIVDLFATIKVDTDRESLVHLKQIKSAIKIKKRSLWPNKEARKIYNELDEMQKKYFKDILIDMIEELELYLSNEQSLS